MCEGGKSPLELEEETGVREIGLTESGVGAGRGPKPSVGGFLGLTSPGEGVSERETVGVESEPPIPDEGGEAERRSDSLSRRGLVRMILLI